MNEILDTFRAIQERHAARHFSSKPLADRLLYDLLDLANRAPSGFNLQPWHFIVVRDQEIKSLLHQIALDQSQVLEAPATVVFVANPHAWRSNYGRILDTGVDSGMISREFAATSRKNVTLTFEIGPLGLIGLAKRLLLPFRRIRKPIPLVITSQQESVHYARAQTMLAAATFMVAATAAGLATAPMEGFDEYRLKKLLAIPRVMSVPIIIPVGYAVDGDTAPASFRLPIVEKVSVDLYPNVLEKVKKKRQDAS